MLKLKQIVVSKENSPGPLFEATHAFGNAGINLRALNLVDTGAFGQLQLMVSDVAKARRLLMEMDIPAMVNEVLTAEIEDRPGRLAIVLKPILDANVQVVFMYVFLRKDSDRAVMIFRFSDNDKAIAIMKENGMTLLDAKQFGSLENSLAAS